MWTLLCHWEGFDPMPLTVKLCWHEVSKPQEMGNGTGPTCLGTNTEELQHTFIEVGSHTLFYNTSKQKAKCSILTLNKKNFRKCSRNCTDYKQGWTIEDWGFGRSCVGMVLCTYSKWLTSFIHILGTELAFKKEEQQLVRSVLKLKCMHQKIMQTQQVVVVYHWGERNTPESIVLQKNTPYRQNIKSLKTVRNNH